MGNITLLILSLIYQGEAEARRRSRFLRLLEEVRSEVEGAQETLHQMVSRVSKLAWQRAEETLTRSENIGVRVISILDAEYPILLRQIDDAPLLLFVRGEKNSLIATQATLAIVGSRRASPENLELARQVACDFVSAGGTVVSGFARGVDGAAHRGALSAKTQVDENQICPSIAVLGCGVDVLYPPEHADLREEFLQAGGVLVSEYGIDSPVRKEFFPERNRIISGLCAATIIVQARQRSGALITARLTLEQNRELYVVPGPVDSIAHEGSNELLNSGALAFVNIEDLKNSLFSLHGSENGCDDQMLRVRSTFNQREYVRGISCQAFTESQAEKYLIALQSISEEDRPLAQKIVETLQSQLAQKGLQFDEFIELFSLRSSQAFAILSRMEMLGILKVSSEQVYSLTTLH